MFGSNCCFFSCIQVSQVTGKVVWYPHLFNNFPQFVVIHIVKGFSIINEVEVDFFFNPLAFSVIQWVLAIWPLDPLPFLSPACTSGSTKFIHCWSLQKWDNQGAGHVVRLPGTAEGHVPTSQGLTKRDPLEKGVENHFGILALRIPWTQLKRTIIWLSNPTTGHIPTIENITERETCTPIFIAKLFIVVRTRNLDIH